MSRDAELSPGWQKRKAGFGWRFQGAMRWTEERPEEFAEAYENDVRETTERTLADVVMSRRQRGTVRASRVLGARDSRLRRPAE